MLSAFLFILCLPFLIFVGGFALSLFLILLAFGFAAVDALFDAYGPR